MGILLMNSPAKIIISNGFSCCSCLHNHDTRVGLYVYMSSISLKSKNRSNFNEINSRIAYTSTSFHGLGASLCCMNLFSLPEKRQKPDHFKVMVASSEPGLVSQRGESIFNEDKGKGGEMNLYYLEERDERVLSKRVLGLSRMNKRASALALFWSMEYSGLRPDLHACNSLLACFWRNNVVDDMVRVFGIMRREKIVSGHSCSLVLKAVAKHCGSDAALQMFNEWEVDSEMKQCFDVIVYNTVISICGKENKWFQMERIWKTMKQNGIVGTIVSYRILVCTFVRCGQYEISTDAYAELLQNGLEPDFDAMHAVIGAYTKEERWDLALSVFQNMLKCKLKPNLIACNALINSLGKAGKLKEALHVYKCIRSLGHTPDSYTFNALLAAFYRTNRYANALQFFDSIQKDGVFKPNLQLYNTALMCCQRLRLWDKALQFLWKMENSGISVSTESYDIVIGACEVARKPKIALQVYEHMVHQKCSPDTFTRLSLIRSCIWGDLWDEVQDILDESTPNVSLYNAVLHGMCLRGRIEAAKSLYVKMQDIGLVPDGKTRALMLQYMLRKST